jgi:hypothetical protein
MSFSNIHLYQIIILLVSTAMIYQGAEKFLKGQSGQTFWKLGIRILVWGGMAAVAIFPNLSNFLADVIGIQGNINAVILTGFFLVFLMIFKLLSAIERLEQQVTLLTRKEALEEITSAEE